MPRTGTRSGPRTRARIAEIASGLFVERGFDAVTVADVAKAADVSSVTVYNHFPTKEDLFLDRASDAEELLRAAVRERASGVDALTSLRSAALRLVDEEDPLSGTSERSVDFLRTVAGSPALIARARGISAALQRVLTEELERDPAFRGDAALLASFLIGGYGVVLTESARALVAGTDVAALRAAHRARVDALFAALGRAFPY